MNRLETFALGEKLSGKIIKHYFYIVRDQDAKQTHAGLQLNSISLKSASLCRPKGSKHDGDQMPNDLQFHCS